MNASLTPDAAEVILRAVTLARRRPTAVKDRGYNQRTALPDNAAVLRLAVPGWNEVPCCAVEPSLDKRTCTIMRFTIPRALDRPPRRDLHGRLASVCPRASLTTAWRSGWNAWSDAAPRRTAGAHPLRRARAVTAMNAARTGSHFGETPRLRTSGSSNKRRTSRPSVIRRTRSRR